MSARANEIRRIADETQLGAREQVISLEQALSSANEMGASLRETAVQSQSVAASTE